MKIALMLLFFVSNMLGAQKPIGDIKENGIYLSDTDYVEQRLTSPFNKSDGIKFRENKKLLITIKAPDRTDTFEYDFIWGYRKASIDWRLFNEQFYQVDFAGKICIYTLPGCLPCLTSPTLYFSSSLTAPLHLLSRKNLIKVYHANTAFVYKIKKLPLTISLEKWDNQNKRYQFINWL